MHWNNLEWVDPKSTPKIFKPFSVSSKKFYISKNDRTSRFVGDHVTEEESEGVDEAIPIHIRKERMTKDYKETMSQDIKTIDAD